MHAKLEVYDSKVFITDYTGRWKYNSFMSHIFHARSRQICARLVASCNSSNTASISGCPALTYDEPIIGTRQKPTATHHKARKWN